MSFSEVELLDDDEMETLRSIVGSIDVERLSIVETASIALEDLISVEVIEPEDLSILYEEINKIALFDIPAKVYEFSEVIKKNSIDENGYLQDLYDLIITNLEVTAGDVDFETLPYRDDYDDESFLVGLSSLHPSWAATVLTHASAWQLNMNLLEGYFDLKKVSENEAGSFNKTGLVLDKYEKLFYKGELNMEAVEQWKLNKDTEVEKEQRKPTSKRKRVSKAMPEIRQVFADFDDKRIEDIKELLKGFKGSDEEHDEEIRTEVLEQLKNLTESNPHYVIKMMSREINEFGVEGNGFTKLKRKLLKSTQELPNIFPKTVNMIDQQDIDDENIGDVLRQYDVLAREDLLRLLADHAVRNETAIILKRIKETLKDEEQLRPQEEFQYVTYLDDVKLDEFDPDWYNESKLDFYGYQKKMVKWMVDITEGNTDLQGGILDAATGTGKTPVIIDVAFVYRNDRFNWTYQEDGITKNMSLKYKTLYVTSATLLTNVRREAQKFFGGQLRIVIFHRDSVLRESGMKAFRYEDMEDYDIVIISRQTLTAIYGHVDNKVYRTVGKKDKEVSRYDTFTSDGKTIKRTLIAAGFEDGPIEGLDILTIGKQLIYNFPWFMTIYDESHNGLTKPTNKTWKAAMALPSMNTFCATATPYKNSLDDLFSQYRVCGATFPDDARMKDLIPYKYNYLRVTKNDQRKEVDIPKIITKIQRVWFSSEEKKKVYMDRQHDYEYARKNYKKLGGYSAALAAQTRMRQAAIDPLLLPPKMYKPDLVGEDRLLELAHSDKIIAARDIIDSNPNDVTIVFSRFIDVLKAFAMWYDNAAVITGDVSSKNRERILQGFHKGEYGVLFITTTIGSEGMTLTRANHVIIMDPWWNVVFSDQVKGRIERMGQKKQPYAYYIVRMETIEERIIIVALNKENKRREIFGSNRIPLDGKLTDEAMEELFGMDI